MKKSDIVIRSYDHRSRPCVNVKIYKFATEDLVRKVAEDLGDKSGLFTLAWIESNISEATRNRFYDYALQDAWQQLTEDVNGEKVFGQTVEVFSAGRSGGWAIVDNFTADDVETWDAIKVAQWAKFAKFARQTADDVPYQYVWQLYTHVFEKWRETQSDKTKAEKVLALFQDDDVRGKFLDIFADAFPDEDATLRDYVNLLQSSVAARVEAADRKL